jgi:hypothetical protein
MFCIFLGCEFSKIPPYDKIGWIPLEIKKLEFTVNNTSLDIISPKVCVRGLQPSKSKN